MKEKMWTNKKIYDIVKKYYPNVYVRAMCKNGYDVVSIESPLGELKRTIPFVYYDKFLKKLCEGVSLTYYERIMKPGNKFLEFGEKQGWL